MRERRTRTHHALPADAARPHPRVTERREPLAEFHLVHLDKVEPDHALRRLCALLGPARSAVERLLDEGARTARRVRRREGAVRRDELGREDVEPVERLGRVRREVVGQSFEQSRGVGGGSGCVRRSTRGLVQTQ